MIELINDTPGFLENLFQNRFSILVVSPMPTARQKTLLSPVVNIHEL